MSDKKHFSDYWFKPYLTTAPASKQEELQNFLDDLSRVGNALDNDVSIKYKMPSGYSDGASENDVLIDPGVAFSSMEYGDKVDVYAGEILLNIALKKNNYGAETNYSKHVANIYNPEESPHVRSSSLLYLAMEVNAAFKFILNKTPGYEDYCKIRAEKVYNKASSKQLQKKFTDDFENSDIFSALIREFDTFNCMPLDYGEHAPVINDIIAQANELERASERLELAKEIAKKYFSDADFKQELANMPSNISADMKAKGTPSPGKGVSGKGKPSEGEGDGEGEDILEKNKDLFANKNLFSSVTSAQPPAKCDESEENGSAEVKENKFSQPKIILTNEVEWKEKGEALKEYTGIKNKVSKITDGIRESLEILNLKLPVWDEYSLRKGNLDEGALHKIADNSDDIFYREEEMPKNFIQVSLLIDESGSMSSHVNQEDSRCDVAKKLATAFLEATVGNSGIDFSIYGHAGPKPNCRVYEYINPEMSEEEFYRVSNIGVKLHNYDGYAIKKVGEELLSHNDKDYKRRLLFVITDGEPSVTNYNGKAALDHTSKVVKELRFNGVDTYAIGVAEFHPATAKHMYGAGNFIIIQDFNLDHVAKVISSFIENICKDI